LYWLFASAVRRMALNDALVTSIVYVSGVMFGNT
jgi:hypothetical protein